MRILLPTRYLYQLLFAICVVVPILNIYELTFVVWITAILLTLTLKFSISILKLIVPFLLIIVIALFSSSFDKFSLYGYVKDITYMLKPALGLILGYQLFKYQSPDRVFKTIIYTGIAIAIIHLLLVVNTFISGKASSLARLRQYCGYFNDFEIYALILLIFHEKFEVHFTKNNFRLYVLILVISSFFYFARTNFIQFIILYIALKGYFKINTKSIIVLTSVVMLVGIGYAIIYNLNPRRNGSGTEQFLYKIKIAPIEPFKTKIDITNWKDLNDNYRSFENVLTIQQVSDAGTQAVIFGKGMGSSVDLKQKIWLQSSDMRYIPFLHNSYMTVFLKSGLTGVFLLLYTIYFLLTIKSSKIPIVNNINLMLVGTGFFLIVSSWVFLGLYNTSDNKALLIGLLIGFTEYKKQTYKNG